MNLRLTIAAHILGMIAFVDREFRRPVTSEELAESIGTNPVIVRRILAQLKRAGLIDSRRGAGGGSVLARDPREITLRQAYEAVAEEDEGFIGRRAQEPDGGCRVAPVITEYLDDVFGEAEEALKHRLAAVSVDEMSRAIVDRLHRRAALRAGLRHPR